MTAKPIRALEMHYPMIQFITIEINIVRGIYFRGDINYHYFMVADAGTAKINLPVSPDPSASASLVSPSTDFQNHLMYFPTQKLWQLPLEV